MAAMRRGSQLRPNQGWRALRPDGQGHRLSRDRPAGAEVCSPAADRVRHFREFSSRSSEQRPERAGRALHGLRHPLSAMGRPAARSTTRSPTGTTSSIRATGRTAARNLHSTNNFPEFTGRICPAPCEEACTLNLEDSPVTIKTIEQAIADKAWEKGWVRPEPAERRPASASPSSARARRASPPPSSSPAPATTCMSIEREAKAGGLLRYGIPDFKMEKHHHRPARRRRWKARA